jgi:hypothetical protein
LAKAIPARSSQRRAILRGSAVIAPRPAVSELSLDYSIVIAGVETVSSPGNRGTHIATKPTNGCVCATEETGGLRQDVAEEGG